MDGSSTIFGFCNHNFWRRWLRRFCGILVSSELLVFIKKIKDKENGKISDDALKLIVKISEGSVRDSLSLLDRETCKVTDFGMARDVQQDNIYERKSKVRDEMKGQVPENSPVKTLRVNCLWDTSI